MAESLGLWSYFCGANAPGRPLGFEEAGSYPTPPLTTRLGGSSQAFTEALPGLGSHHILAGGEARTGQPWIQFVGERTLPFALHAVTTDLSGQRRVVPIPVTPAGSSSYEVPADWSELAFLVLLVTNAGLAPSPAEYLVTLDDQNAVGVPALTSGGFSLEPNRPNPFRRTTTIAFSLAAEGRVRLAIYDVAGRLVRRLIDGDRLGEGAHERTWDGLDAAGRPAAPGVYYYRLETSRRAANRKMLLLH